MTKGVKKVGKKAFKTGKTRKWGVKAKRLGCWKTKKKSGRVPFNSKEKCAPGEQEGLAPGVQKKKKKN